MQKSRDWLVLILFFFNEISRNQKFQNFIDFLERETKPFCDIFPCLKLRNRDQHVNGGELPAAVIDALVLTIDGFSHFQAILEKAVFFDPFTDLPGIKFFQFPSCCAIEADKEKQEFRFFVRKSEES